MSRTRAARGALLLIALATLPPLDAQTAPDARPPILIQGAMAAETDKLASRLDDAVIHRVGAWTFWRGTIDGYPVIVSRTLKGASNAAAATVLAIERYRPAAIINQGTAGGHDPALRLYDIVLGTRSVNIGAFKSPYRAAGAGSNPLEWTPLDLTRDGSAAADPAARRPAAFAGDPELLAAARVARAAYTKGKVVEGVIGTSDAWNDEVDVVLRFNARYGTLVEEMETAAAAQVAGLFGVPFLGIRVVSDNITNGTAWDPRTGEACEDFAYEVVRAYIAMLAR